MDDIIMAKDAEKAEKESKRLKKARNRALSLITDAKNRYIKEKTRARSKKAAAEKGAILESSRFECLKEYEKRDEIQEAYGWDFINEKERDHLEALWDEREELKKHSVDGVYTDEVTEALDQAYIHIADIWDDEITKADTLVKDFNEQIKEMRAEGYNV